MLAGSIAVIFTLFKSFKNWMQLAGQEAMQSLPSMLMIVGEIVSKE